MSRNYYISQSGRLRRKDNTIYLEKEDGSRVPIPIEDVNAFYLYGELDPEHTDSQLHGTEAFTHPRFQLLRLLFGHLLSARIPELWIPHGQAGAAL